MTISEAESPLPRRVSDAHVLGWAIVGLGRSADHFIGPAINADPHSRLVAVASRDHGRARSFARRHHAGVAVTDYESLLAVPGVDIIAIATPNALHREMATAAARAGKHVFCDKPMALSVRDAEVMVEACASAEVRLGVNFQGRHNPVFQAAKRVIQAGEIGDIVSIQIDASPGDTPLEGWRADRDMAGLGAVNNIGVHLYDLVRYLTESEVTEVTALFDTGRERKLERLPFVLMRLTNGALVFANGNQATPKPLDDLAIHGTRGRIDGRGITRVGPRSRILRIANDMGVRSERHVAEGAYARTVAAFCEAVLDGRDPSPSGIDGLRSVQLTEAIHRSALEGRHFAPANAEPRGTGNHSSTAGFA